MSKLDKLTIGQQKAVVTAYLFGLSEINGNAWRGLVKHGFAKPGELDPITKTWTNGTFTADGIAAALTLITRKLQKDGLL